MLRFTQVLERPLTAAESVRAVRLRLTHEERAKSRLATMTVDGVAVAIVLPQARRGTVLRHGTVLAGDEAVFAIIDAAQEPVTRVTAATPLALLRAVYHLANRHVPAQLTPSFVLIERDPVLERLLLALGAQIEHLTLPFDPEPGAYEAHGHGHGGHAHHGEVDEVSATLGERLSIEAHQRRRA